MKKALTMIFTIVLVLNTCINSIAVMYSADSNEIKGYINNKSGAVCYDDNGKQTDEKISYKQSITIIDDGYIDYDGLIIAEFDDNRKFVSIKDVNPIEKEVMPIEENKLSNTLKVVCINKSGSSIKSGPGEYFDTIGTIPYEGKAEIEYGCSNMGFDFSLWTYGSYNGINGWLHTANYGCAYDFAVSVEKNSQYNGKFYTLENNLTLGELTIPYEYNNRKAFITIPKNTLLEFDYYYVFPLSIMAYTEYKGIKGWISVGEIPDMSTYDLISKVATGYNQSIMYIKADKVKLYSKPYEQGQLIGTLSISNTEIRPDLEAQDNKNNKASYYVTIEGKTGWLTFDMYSDNYIEAKDYPAFYMTADNVFETKNAEKEYKLYENPDLNSKIIGIVKENTIYTCRLTKDFTEDKEFRYIEFNNNKGWILPDSRNADCYTTELFAEDAVNEETTNVKSNTIVTTTTMVSETNSEQTEKTIEGNNYQWILSLSVGIIILTLITGTVIYKRKKSQ